MNVIYNKLDSSTESESFESIEENGSENSSVSSGSVDFVKLYKVREGLGLYEPSLPRFPNVGSFLGREVQDPSTKFKDLKQFRDFEVGINFDEAMEGLTMANSKVSFVEQDKILFREECLSLTNRVKIISGGKGISSDLVGRGMLTCAVMGIGGAPKPRVIFVAIRQLAKGDEAGIIAIVPKNFEDELNWGMAVARARERGMNVILIPVGDASCACMESFEKRGLAGMTLYFKIAGGMSEEKYSLKAIYKKLYSLSIATISCNILETFFICTDFDGLCGIPLPKASKEKAIKEMIRLLIDPKEKQSLGYEPGSKFVLLVNAYSGNWHFLQSISVEATKQLQENNIDLAQVYSGFYLSANTLGFSITLLAEVDSQIIRWLNDFTTCPGWTYPSTGLMSSVCPSSCSMQKTRSQEVPDYIANTLFLALTVMFTRALEAEAQLNEIDNEGVYGTTFSSVAQRILDGLKSNELDTKQPYNLFYGISEFFLDGFNNADGIMYGIFFTAIASVFRSSNDNGEDKINFDKNTWVSALKNAVLMIESYFLVDFSDGTIIDIFGPICLLLCAAKYEHSIVRALNLAIEIGSEKLKTLSESRKITRSPRATVYGAYILAKAFASYLTTILLTDSASLDQGCESLKKSEFEKEYGRSVSIGPESGDVGQYIQKAKFSQKGENLTGLKRVNETDDIFKIKQ